MSNADLRSIETPQATAAPQPQPEDAAIERILNQLDDWRELNESNEEVAQTLLDQAYEFHHGYGIEREIEMLELTVEESAQCRLRSVAAHYVISDRKSDRHVSSLVDITVSVAEGVRASRLLSLKRRELEVARERALLDAAARLDRLLKRGITPMGMTATPLPMDRPTLSWRITQSGSVQDYVLGLKGKIKNGTRRTNDAGSITKLRGTPGFGLAGSLKLPTTTAKAGTAPPAQAATSTVS